MFEFASQRDAEVSNSLGFLVRKNNGQFKTAKQAQFLTKTLGGLEQRAPDFTESILRYYGIEVASDQYICKVEAFVNWSDYGVRGMRPVTWVYVMDTQGVVAQYKLKYVGDMRQGTCPDPEKTQLVWKREGELTPLVFEAPVEVAPSEYVGMVGERIELTGTIKAVFEFEKRKFHYYDTSIGYITKLDVNGNDVVYFGQLGDKGDTVTVKATIKEHGIRDGRKQTIISRPKLV